jgi:hypothetical protein
MLLWGEREAEATSHFKQPVACEETLLQTAKIVSQSVSPLRLSISLCNMSFMNLVSKKKDKYPTAKLGSWRKISGI